MPHYGYVYDPNANDPGWKNVTGECQLLFDDVMSKAENLFGPRTSTLPVLITEFSTGPHINFINNSIAYIRLGPGVRAGANLTPAEARQLKHQLALEIVHLLSVPVGAPMTALEEGASGYAFLSLRVLSPLCAPNVSSYGEIIFSPIALI